MARMESQMLSLGTIAPNFSLSDPDGNIVTRDGAMGERGLLVMFICNHCPYVRHVRDELARLGREWPERGVGFVAINSNDYDAYPDDSPDAMRAEIKEVGYAFPYLVDETQEVARAYGAVCTPDLFLFDAQARLVYRGRIDESRPDSGIPVTGADIRAALSALVQGAEPIPEQHPSVGCSIKWRS